MGTGEEQANQSPADFVREDLVVLGMNAHTAREVVDELSRRLLAAGFVRETFADALWEREQKHPTGLPLAGSINVAIPHADIEHVIAPALAVATLKQPVTFQNMIDPDEPVPVLVVIVMALNEAHAQVEMLQKLAFLFQDEERVERLYRATSFEDVRRVLSGASS